MIRTIGDQTLLPIAILQTCPLLTRSSAQKVGGGNTPGAAEGAPIVGPEARSGCCTVVSTHKKSRTFLARFSMQECKYTSGPPTRRQANKPFPVGELVELLYFYRL